MEQGKNIRVALVGNPNTGRTTLFNKLTGAHDSTGNYPRVTVGMHEIQIEHKGWQVQVVDLPGIYSMSSQTEEELTARQFIFERQADVLINVLDMGHLERNLLLTTELIETGVPCLFALNMKDEAHAHGIEIDDDLLARFLGGPVIEIDGHSGEGSDELLDAIIAYAEKNLQFEAVKIGYDDHLEATIEKVSGHIETLHPEELDVRQARWLAIKLIEGDETTFRQEADHAALMELVKSECATLEQQHGEDAEMLLNSGRFGFVNGVLEETSKINDADKVSRNDVTKVLDTFLLHRYMGLPLFLGLMYLMFEATFTLGNYPMDWIDAGVGLISDGISAVLPDSLFKQLLIDGVIAGVGGTIIFLPNIVILFFFIAFFSESGYLARAAFLVDRFMHVFGLHGKAFIPMVTGFGCNVPAIMATRTIENKNDRLVAMMVTPFMSCSARLPVFILFSGAFFADMAGKMLFLMYIISVGVALITAVILSKTAIKGANTSPLLMELPPYRKPTMNSVMVHMGSNAAEFLKKVGGIIVVGSIVIWLLQTFPQEVQLSKDYSQQISMLEAQPETEATQQEIVSLNQEMDSEVQKGRYLGQVGGFVEPIFAPLGFDLNSSIALLTGFVAKEVVVATYGVLYAQGDGVTEDDKTLQENISGTMSPVTALAFMVFTLFYMPCFATLAMFYKESRSLKWTGVNVGLSLGVAYFLAFSISSVGGMMV